MAKKMTLEHMKPSNEMHESGGKEHGVGYKNTRSGMKLPSEDVILHHTHHKLTGMKEAHNYMDNTDAGAEGAHDGHGKEHEQSVITEGGGSPHGKTGK